jgi:L-seryl-tRNA(Ser) seleniumtransferase
VTIAALEATLRLHATGRRAEIPLWRSIEMPQRHVVKRARAIATSMRSDGTAAAARSSEAVVGGGSLPGYAIPSAELVIPTAEPNDLAALLRTGQPAVFCKVGPAEVAFDLRTVPPEDDDRLTHAIRHALGSP